MVKNTTIFLRNSCNTNVINVLKLFYNSGKIVIRCEISYDTIVDNIDTITVHGDDKKQTVKNDGCAN